MVIRVMIISAIRLYREGLEHVLGEDEHIDIVGTTASVREALGNLDAIKPDVVLLDVAANDPATSIQHILEQAPNTQVVALSVPDNDDELIACAEAGVAGFVTRDGRVEELIASIKAAAAGELSCSPRVAGLLVKRVAALAAKQHKDDLVTDLTRRELNILELIGQGHCNKEIARALHIEVATVKNHVHNILKKLKVNHRAEAAALSHRLHGTGDNSHDLPDRFAT
jgi:two-component system, NarL family, nitrate/nitrite response regulator NarL